MRPDPPQRCALRWHPANRIRAGSQDDCRQPPQSRREYPKTAVR